MESVLFKFIGDTTARAAHNERFFSMLRFYESWPHKSVQYRMLRH